MDVEVTSGNSRMQGMPDTAESLTLRKYIIPEAASSFTCVMGKEAMILYTYYDK